eukprot:scaffold11891_cov213-Skeletonema_menzelii.AAC.4
MSMSAFLIAIEYYAVGSSFLFSSEREAMRCCVLHARRQEERGVRLLYYPATQPTPRPRTGCTSTFLAPPSLYRSLLYATSCFHRSIN